MPGFGLEREQDLDFQGVYRLPAGGGKMEDFLVDDFVQPNGLCFSPDESLLYIDDTDRAHIRVFDIGPRTTRCRTAACSPRTSATATSRRAASSTA